MFTRWRSISKVSTNSHDNKRINLYVIYIGIIDSLEFKLSINKDTVSLVSDKEQ